MSLISLFFIPSRTPYDATPFQFTCSLPMFPTLRRWLTSLHIIDPRDLGLCFVIRYSVYTCFNILDSFALSTLQRYGGYFVLPNLFDEMHIISLIGHVIGLPYHIATRLHFKESIRIWTFLLFPTLQMYVVFSRLQNLFDEMHINRLNCQLLPRP